MDQGNDPSEGSAPSFERPRGQGITPILQAMPESLAHDAFGASLRLDYRGNGPVQGSICRVMAVLTEGGVTQQALSRLRACLKRPFWPPECTMPGRSWVPCASKGLLDSPSRCLSWCWRYAISRRRTAFAASDRRWEALTRSAQARGLQRRQRWEVLYDSMRCWWPENSVRQANMAFRRYWHCAVALAVPWRRKTLENAAEATASGEMQGLVWSVGVLF